MVHVVLVYSNNSYNVSLVSSYSLRPYSS